MADSDEEIRAMVLACAVKVKHAQAAELSVKGLSDPSDKVKQVAANGIKELKIRKALPELWKRLRYGTPELRRAVLAGIVELSTIEERKKQLSNLAALFYGSDVPTQMLAVDAVRGFRDPVVYANLGALVEAESIELRVKTLHALGETKDPRAIEYVVNGLLADEKECKLAALSALRNINSMKAEKPLQEYITNEVDAELKIKAEEVLDGLTG
jgi:hypothetical protein